MLNALGRYGLWTGDWEGSLGETGQVIFDLCSDSQHYNATSRKTRDTYDSVIAAAQQQNSGAVRRPGER